jgi:ABC-2 type transport system ATP-binding protein
VIRIRQLAKSYGAQPAVRGIDLDIPAGQLVGLLGPNGAGKTTTIKMLAGILRPDAGTAELCGHDVVHDPLAVKRVVGYVPESGAVFETLTGWEYLTLVAALHSLTEADARQRIERFATFFELDHAKLHDQQLGAQSKGTRQRVVISAALLHNPLVVLLDEPLGGLDANAALALKTLLTALARDGKTILYCSHVLDVVERMCERVVIIHHGQVVADGAVAELEARTGETSLERVFNRLTASENLLARAEEFARVLAR